MAGGLTSLTESPNNEGPARDKACMHDIMITQ